MPNSIEVVATALFVIAIIHTFSVPVFARLSSRGGSHAGLWHLLSEVEVVFGFWAFILLALMAFISGSADAVRYIDTRDYTEPVFVFVIMVVAASRPILELVNLFVHRLASVVPIRSEMAIFFITLSFVPLSGSLITEPAAMTLAALLLRDAFFSRTEQLGVKYMTIGVLFVNVSIGGVLTSYAAPPVLMVAHTFGWDTLFMATHFGWRAVGAIFFNAAVLTLICRRCLLGSVMESGTGAAVAHLVNNPSVLAAAPEQAKPAVPFVIMVVHLIFLVGVVLSAHHPIIFLGLLLLFVGFTSAYSRHQSRLMINEALMVGFFLAGLVTLGGMQKWWLQDLLAGLSPLVLFWGATALTAVTDNAALTYLGSLVEGTGDLWRYMLVAGSVTGGGLTVIANAPNPAGFSILKSCFPNGAISPLKLLYAASLPTAVAAGMFLLPNSFG